jgi:hypothetical protein
MCDILYTLRTELLESLNLGFELRPAYATDCRNVRDCGYVT